MLQKDKMRNIQINNPKIGLKFQTNEMKGLNYNSKYEFNNISNQKLKIFPKNLFSKNKDIHLQLEIEY